MIFICWYIHTHCSDITEKSKEEVFNGGGGTGIEIDEWEEELFKRGGLKIASTTAVDSAALRQTLKALEKSTSEESEVNVAVQDKMEMDNRERLEGTISKNDILMNVQKGIDSLILI